MIVHMHFNRWLERIYAASVTRPPRGLIRAAGAVHRLTIVSTGGRLGTVLLDHPILLLRTIGRRTGKPRTQPLMYLREADCYLVAASFGGHDQDPAWLRNVQASPRATITVEGRDVPVLATIATPEERERLWPRFLSLSAAYGKYQGSTNRQIPIVKLSPSADGDGSSRRGPAA